MPAWEYGMPWPTTPAPAFPAANHRRRSPPPARYANCAQYRYGKIISATAHVAGTSSNPTCACRPCTDADYAHRYDLRPHHQMSVLRWAFIQHWLRLPTGSRVLDVGYGNGSFLKHARRHGMRVHGIDVHGEDFGVPTVDLTTTIELTWFAFSIRLSIFLSSPRCSACAPRT